MTKEEDDGARKQWYLQSYEYFVKYFEDKKCLEKDDIVVGIAMAYSWMPKVPRLLKTKKSQNKK